MNLGLEAPLVQLYPVLLLLALFFALTTNVFTLSAPGKTSDRVGMNAQEAPWIQASESRS